MELFKSLNSQKKKLKDKKNREIAAVYAGEKIKINNRLSAYINSMRKYDTDVFVSQVYKINDACNHIINSHLQAEEAKAKDHIISDVYKENRKQGKIFYIASSHDDSAEDHRDFQARVYIDRYCGDKEALAYAREHGIRTVQWVTSKPVWFVTRPHCRHYFVAADKEKIMSGKYHIPHKAVGRDNIKTPKDITLEMLYDRLDMLERMQAKKPTEILKHKILKTKLLIRQWSKR